ncbi:MAG: GDP-mannose 4,6-dehydratase [Candidatus Zapsychrus exili]|nr:GDP-mannose 4,6-dehydratase [Candidatus Zapsychrus exili]
MNKFAKKRVLITGGSGFIPSHLTRRLVKMGAEVGIITKYNSLIDNIRLVDVWDSLHIIEADIRNQDSLRQIKDFKPHIIYHFAAYNHVGDSFLHVSEALDCNIKGTANVIDAYDDYERFVYISTSESYGEQTEVPFEEEMFPRPVSPYAVGKYGGELYCRMKMSNMNKPVSILRPFNAFGPYQSPRAIITEIIIKCLRGEVIESTEGKQTRDFNYVDNLVDGFILAAESEKSIGNVINLGSDRDIAIRDLIILIHKESESKSELKIGALPYRPTEIWQMRAANKKALDLLKWKPTVSLEEGLKKTISWYRKYLEVYKSSKSSLWELSC